MTTNPLDDFSIDGWENLFVEAEPRPAQVDTMKFLERNWNNCDNFLVCAPTGVGKSAIALTLARVLAAQVPSPYADKEDQPGYSYITTTSIELQEQYMANYAKFGLQKLYSASNFKCTRSFPMNCKEGSTICKTTKTKCPRTCVYEDAKREFIRNPYGIMNLAYYMFESHFVGKLQKRGLMVFDEAHNIGDAVKSFVTITISDAHLKHHQIRPPRAQSNNLFAIADLKEWLHAEYEPSISRDILKLTDKKENWSGSMENKDYLKLCNDLADLEAIIKKIDKLFQELTPVDWIAEKTDMGINITPITPKKYMRQHLIGKNFKNVFMSATLFDKQFIMDEYDLDPARTCYFTTPSPFPIKNRPIYILPAGKIEYGNLKKSMMPFAEVMKDILDGHKGERGIVFVSSYAQAHEFVLQVNNKRLITHYSNKDKNYALEQHRASKDGVFVSPSSHEGLDLVGDTSRFQVLLKLPFLSLGSASVRKRAELYERWYAYMTVLSIIQASGRSIRSETDWATTYILDSNWLWFFPKWERFFPRYWSSAIVK